MTQFLPQISDDHRRRRALGYLRQSSMDQVRDHSGSTAVQRDLPELFRELGWPDELIEIIDDDLGVSGSTPGLRAGFQRLIREMRTGTVGAVAVTDPSRLARNFEDLVQFVNAAREHNVLLIHGHQVVDFNDPNSEFVSLLLGINAVRENRARVDFSKRARRKKAEAGLATTPPPAGYVTVTRGYWDKDSDPEVQNAIALVFTKFLELRSCTKVARWFRQQGLKLPGRRM